MLYGSWHLWSRTLQLPFREAISVWLAQSRAYAEKQA
jgi:hypothetical protein